MTVLALPSPGHSDEPLLTKLRSAVRPEFRTEIIRIDPDDPVFARDRCEVGDCSRGAWARSLCSSHYNRWRRHGQPDLATFTATAGPLQLKPSSRLAETFDLRALPEQTRLELAYSIQCRHDDRTVRLMPTMISGLVRLLANSDVQSLLDRSLEQWREAVDAAALSGTGDRTRGQLRYAWRHLHDLNDGADAETEFARDIWRASMLGTPQTRHPQQIRFDGTTQPWLRAAVKRCARFRLGAGKVRVLSPRRALHPGGIRPSPSDRRDRRDSRRSHPAPSKRGPRSPHGVWAGTAPGG